MKIVLLVAICLRCNLSGTGCPQHSAGGRSAGFQPIHSGLCPQDISGHQLLRLGQRYGNSTQHGSQMDGASSNFVDYFSCGTLFWKSDEAIDQVAQAVLSGYRPGGFFVRFPFRGGFVRLISCRRLLEDSRLRADNKTCRFPG